MGISNSLEATDATVNAIERHLTTLFTRSSQECNMGISGKVRFCAEEKTLMAPDCCHVTCRADVADTSPLSGYLARSKDIRWDDEYNSQCEDSTP